MKTAKSTRRNWSDFVGQVGNLRRIGNPPGVDSGIIYGPIANRPQVANLPHKISMILACVGFDFLRSV